MSGTGIHCLIYRDICVEATAHNQAYGGDKRVGLDEHSKDSVFYRAVEPDSLSSAASAGSRRIVSGRSTEGSRPTEGTQDWMD